MVPPMKRHGVFDNTATMCREHWWEGHCTLRLPAVELSDWGTRPPLGEYYDEGERCNRVGCDGTMEVPPVENCTCFISPPCNACVYNELTCTDCGAQVG
jgi:hypothetical protein